MDILAANALNFSSMQFVFRILPVFLLAYYVTPQKRKNGILLIGSLLFYTMAQPSGLLLLGLSVLINYGIARKIGSVRIGINPEVPAEESRSGPAKLRKKPKAKTRQNGQREGQPDMPAGDGPGREMQEAIQPDMPAGNGPGREIQEVIQPDTPAGNGPGREIQKVIQPDMPAGNGPGREIREAIQPDMPVGNGSGEEIQKGTQAAHQGEPSLNVEGYRIRRRVWLLLALVYNFGMLLLFKYVGPAGAVPLGMSFYTFRIVSYVLDVYEMQIDAEASLLRLGTYLCMFPTLVSGPVTRYDSIGMQLDSRIHSPELFEDGLKTFVLGLAAKLVLADRIAILWHEVQTIGFSGISTPLAWMGAFAYTFQIYFDFQGYSLMAIGAGKMLGFHLPDNFRQPYASRSFGEFWRRWHITLGEWFRDYVYIPLGGNRRGKLRTCVNLLIVWLLTGIWHGSTVNYLIWGISVGLLLVAERLFLRRLLDRSALLSHLYMFFMIPLTWVVFAIPDLKQLGLYFTRLFPLGGGAAGVNPADYLKYAGMFGGIFALCILFCVPALGSWYQQHKKHPLVILFLTAAFWAAVYYGANSLNNPFVYLNF